MHIKQERTTFITHNCIDYPTLDLIISQRNSSIPTSVCEQFAGNIWQTISKSELAMYVEHGIKYGIRVHTVTAGSEGVHLGVRTRVAYSLRN